MIEFEDPNIVLPVEKLGDFEFHTNCKCLTIGHERWIGDENSRRDPFCRSIDT